MKNLIEIRDFSNITHLSIFMSLDGRLYLPIKHSEIIELEILVKKIIQNEPDPNKSSVIGVEGELKIFGEICPCKAEFDFESKRGKIYY